MNKYDELLDRAKMFYDQPMVGELINAVRELRAERDAAVKDLAGILAKAEYAWRTEQED